MHPHLTDDVEVRARKYGEVVVNTFSSVASVLQYPKGKWCSFSLTNLFPSLNGITNTCYSLLQNSSKTLLDLATGFQIMKLKCVLCARSSLDHCYHFIIVENVAKPFVIHALLNREQYLPVAGILLSECAMLV